jgi:hypothetical protein
MATHGKKFLLRASHWIEKTITRHPPKEFNEPKSRPFSCGWQIAICRIRDYPRPYQSALRFVLVNTLVLILRVAFEIAFWRLMKKPCQMRDVKTASALKPSPLAAYIGFPGFSFVLDTKDSCCPWCVAVRTRDKEERAALSRCGPWHGGADHWRCTSVKVAAEHEDQHR